MVLIPYDKCTIMSIKMNKKVLNSSQTTQIKQFSKLASCLDDANDTYLLFYL